MVEEIVLLVVQYENMVSFFYEHTYDIKPDFKVGWSVNGKAFEQ